MSLLESFVSNMLKYGLEYFKLYYSEYDGTCMDNEDPGEQGRIKVKVPSISGNEALGSWAWPKAPWAGRDSGAFWVPDVGDPVIVTFRNGNPKFPRYAGGWWPRVDGTDNFAAGFDAYTDGKPSKRIFKTKAGHELSFEDDPASLSCKLVWHDPEKDVYTFFAFTKDGSIQTANHKGCFVELRATDDDELVLIMDKNGNTFTQNKDGTVVADASGNVFEMKKDAVQIIGTKDVIINSQSVNLKAGGVDIGDVAIEKTVKGTSWLLWWTTTMLIWLNTHTHPSGVGPTGPPLVPAQPPQDAQLLTDKLKVQ
jgi:hypothetical protein